MTNRNSSGQNIFSCVSLAVRRFIFRNSPKKRKLIPRILVWSCALLLLVHCASNPKKEDFVEQHQALWLPSGYDALLFVSLKNEPALVEKIFSLAGDKALTDYFKNKTDFVVLGLYGRDISLIVGGDFSNDLIAKVLCQSGFMQHGTKDNATWESPSGYLIQLPAKGVLVYQTKPITSQNNLSDTLGFWQDTPRPDVYVTIKTQGAALPSMGDMATENLEIRASRKDDAYLADLRVQARTKGDLKALESVLRVALLAWIDYPESLQNIVITTEGTSLLVSNLRVSKTTFENLLTSFLGLTVPFVL